MHKAYFDASYDWNKGIAALAYVIYNHKGKVIDEAVYMTRTDDSNEAEVIALIKLLKRLRVLGVRDVSIYGDNKGVIETANGQKLDGKNREKYNMIIELTKGFGHVCFDWISRKYNKVADSLTRREKKLIITTGSLVAMGKRNKNKINTYQTTPKYFDYNFRYKESRRRVFTR